MYVQYNSGNELSSFRSSSLQYDKTVRGRVLWQCMSEHFTYYNEVVLVSKNENVKLLLL